MSGVSLIFSASCPKIGGEGYGCMVCTDWATGHITVTGGPNDGRCLAIVCPRHASPAGWEDVKSVLVQWMDGGLLSRDLGPGPDGAPEVLHIDHLDPLPDHRHEVPLWVS